jgi:hypothetical protein
LVIFRVELFIYQRVIVVYTLVIDGFHGSMRETGTTNSAPLSGTSIIIVWTMKAKMISMKKGYSA